MYPSLQRKYYSALKCGASSAVDRAAGWWATMLRVLSFGCWQMPSTTRALPMKSSEAISIARINETLACQRGMMRRLSSTLSSMEQAMQSLDELLEDQQGMALLSELSSSETTPDLPRRLRQLRRQLNVGTSEVVMAGSYICGATPALVKYKLTRRSTPASNQEGPSS